MNKPKVKFSELQEEERLVILTIIRLTIQKTNILEKFPEIGFEKTEEYMIKLIEEGLLHILYNDKTDSFCIVTDERMSNDK